MKMSLPPTNSLYKILISSLLAIVGFIGAQLYSKLIDMDKNIATLNVSIAQLQSTMMTEEKIIVLAKTEIIKYHINKERYISK